MHAPLLKKYPIMQLVHTVADVQASHPVPHAVHKLLLLKKYPVKHAVHCVAASEVQTLHPAAHPTHEPLFK